MSLKTYAKEVEHLGESQVVKDHNLDMIHDQSRRLDVLFCNYKFPQLNYKLAKYSVIISIFIRQNFKDF